MPRGPARPAPAALVLPAMPRPCGGAPGGGRSHAAGGVMTPPGGRVVWGGGLTDVCCESHGRGAGGSCGPGGWHTRGSTGARQGACWGGGPAYGATRPVPRGEKHRRTTTPPASTPPASQARTKKKRTETDNTHAQGTTRTTKKTHTIRTHTYTLKLWDRARRGGGGGTGAPVPPPPTLYERRKLPCPSIMAYCMRSLRISYEVYWGSLR